MATDSLPNVWVVRADGGQHTEACVKGGFTGIGWNDVGDLTHFDGRDEMMRSVVASKPWYREGMALNTMARFYFDIQAGDYVITPGADSRWLRYGRVADGQSYYYYQATGGDRPYAHRRKVDWVKQPLNRLELSIPLQGTLRSALTVFKVRQGREFLQHIGVLPREHSPRQAVHDDFYKFVLERILELSAQEFEELVEHVLAALGFEDTQVTGRSGDQGVDVKGTLNNSGLVRVDVYVQAKRYKLGSKVGAGDVRKLRQVIPGGGQGAVITTAGFQKKAYDAATEHGFPRVGLIDGRQLVDILVEHWDNIPEEFHDKLGIRPGLVPA